MSDDDLISVVVYNESTQLFQSLGRLGDVRRSLVGTIARLEAGGNTNIPPALEAAAAQLRQADGRYVRRVVLVSDGNDHSGWDLGGVAALVRERAGTGSTFSALGVGTDYSEAFMTSVADAGRGNYAFLERGADLRPFLQRELDQAARTVADNLVATLQLPPSWRLRACYGAEALGQSAAITIPIGSLVTDERRRVVLSLEVDAGAAGHTPPISLALAYQHTPTRRWQSVAAGGLALAVTSDVEAVAASTDAVAHADTLTTVVDERQARSIEAWRGGDRASAVALTNDNIAQLGQLQALSYSAERARRIDEYRQDIDNFNDSQASSQGGRAYGLSSNFQRRSRARGW
jgi:Ca-activated chloride channel family protein